MLLIVQYDAKYHWKSNTFNKISSYEVYFPVKFMISRGGDRLMKLGDFTFTRVQFQGEHSYWSCYTHNSHGCPAKVYTERNRLIYAKNLHNHPPTEFFV